MNQTATARKWASLKLLHEQHGAGFELLAAAASLRPGTLQARAQLESWKTGSQSQALLRRAMSACERELAVLCGEESGEIDDKRSRSLANLTKSVETLAATAERVAAATLKPGGKDSRDAEEAALDSATELELDRQLAGQIERVVNEGTT